MKKIGFMMLGMLFFLMGCQNEETIAPEQAKTWTKEHLWMVRTVEGQPLTRAVAVKDKLWQAGDTIRIKFLPGGSDSPALEAKVQQYAAEWLQYAGLYFEYVDVADSADVKIGFDLDSRYLSWSVMGTDCRMVAQDECSLNFFELGMYGEEFDRAEVLRGFGHVLGLGFEHRSPESPIVFNSRAETYFKEDCRLTDQDVADLLALYNTDQTNYTDYDENSIMLLDLPRLILTTPHVMISSNLELSEMDKEFIAEIYPFMDGALITMKTAKQEFYMWGTFLSDIQVDWGDGCIETNIFRHSYSDGLEHTIKLWGDSLAIKEIGVGNNNLTYLKTNNCRNLESLYCEGNLIKRLDVSKNPLLLNLACDNNKITKLDVSQCTFLIRLSCFDNPISQLDLTRNLALTQLIFNNFPWEDLDICCNINIDNLLVDGLIMDSLELHCLVNLKGITCQYCSLKYLDVSKNPKMNWIGCNDNQLTTLNTAHNYDLLGIMCSNNLITSLDLSNNPNLVTLECSNNPLQSLNVANNLKLNAIFLSNVPLLYNNVELMNFVNSLPIKGNISDRGHLYIKDSLLVNQIQPLVESKNWDVSIN